MDPEPEEGDLRTDPTRSLSEVAEPTAKATAEVWRAAAAAIVLALERDRAERGKRERI